MKKILLLFSLHLSLFSCFAQSIEECQRMAVENYPLVKRYDLIRQTEQFTLSNIQKGWLPQLVASAQATYQSAVTEWPADLKTMLQQMGNAPQGLDKFQWRAGVDVQQTIYDGGAIGAARGVAKAKADADEAQNAVNLYNVRSRVNDLYFSWLLVEERLKQNYDMQMLLKSNVQELETLFNNGVAMGCDVDDVRAELSAAKQQQTELEAVRETVRGVLSLLCGQEISWVEKPQNLLPPADVNRPEITVFDKQLDVLAAQRKALDSNLLPKLGAFAQGYYGYPGLNMFRDMYERSGTLNGIVGVKLSWNISSLYTRKSDLAKLTTQQQDIEIARETFLFNNRLQSTQQDKQITLYRRLMTEDDEIIRLRENVRKAAEAKLSGGIIDTNNLLQEITKENQAKINKATHEVEMLKHIYELKNIKGYE